MTYRFKTQFRGFKIQCPCLQKIHFPRFSGTRNSINTTITNNTNFFQNFLIEMVTIQRYTNRTKKTYITYNDKITITYTITITIELPY